MTTHTTTMTDEAHAALESSLRPDTGPLEVALLRAAKAALGDSNDREIDALGDVVDEALALFPHIDIDAIEAEAMVWAEGRGLV